MASRVEVDHNALCGPGPAGGKKINRNLNLADKVKKDNGGAGGGRMCEQRGREYVMKRQRDSKKDDTDVLGLANVATECFAHSRSASTLVSRRG